MSQPQDVSVLAVRSEGREPCGRYDVPPPCHDSFGSGLPSDSALMRPATCTLANPEATARTIRHQRDGLSPGSRRGVVPGTLRYPPSSGVSWDVPRLAPRVLCDLRRNQGWFSILPRI
jgi:hypothetical protein